jgi:transposase-like protein
MIEAYEKDCPVCGHKTLMKQCWRGCGINADNFAPRFYCYSCGSTFKEVTESKLVKVEG